MAKLLPTFIMSSLLLSSTISALDKSQTMSAKKNSFSKNSFNPIEKVSRKNRTKKIGVNVRLEMGSGVYQDIQVPVNERFQRRSDGTDTVDEHVEHRGIPLLLSLSSTDKSRHFTFVYGASYLYMIKLGPTTASSFSRSGSAAGYDRFDLFYSTAYRIPEGSSEFHLGAELRLRRSSYNNTSSGHLIESILPGVYISYGSDLSWKFGGKFSTSAYSSLSYDNGIGIIHDKIKNSTASVSQFSITTTAHLSQNVWANFEFINETSQISIDDVKAYEQYGLLIETSGIKNRKYEMKTQTMTLGLKKRF